ncbi:hypothetical protein [Nitrospirillum viridazoti]|uniref:hypothetical protein n=1 Tax=Nitrospirillum viridazoti TaxID=3144925 RepID=UPI0018E9DF1C|nr:hypothetical protein [Nitrospirillum amazonense]
MTDRAPYAIILGTNEIASAVAIRLHQQGYGVVMSHDPSPPVIRRKMAFHDALFDDPVTLAGIAAERVDDGMAAAAALARRQGVVITELGLLDLIVIRTLDLLVDARLQKYSTTPDLRRLAKVTVGLGPGFTAGENCDFAIETKPGKQGALVRQGATEPADGIVRPLGNRGRNASPIPPSPAAGTRRWRSAPASSRTMSSAIWAPPPSRPLSTASCAAWCGTGRRCRPASSCWRSIPVSGAPSGPASTTAPTP